MALIAVSFVLTGLINCGAGGGGGSDTAYDYQSSYSEAAPEPTPAAAASERRHWSADYGVKGLDLFEPHEIADAQLQLEDGESNVLQYESSEYVRQVSDCRTHVNGALDAWLAKVGLVPSTNKREESSTLMIVDIAQPAPGFLYLAYRRYDEGRRAGVVIKFDTPGTLTPQAKEQLIRQLELVSM